MGMMFESKKKHTFYRVYFFWYKYFIFLVYFLLTIRALLTCIEVYPLVR